MFWESRHEQLFIWAVTDVSRKRHVHTFIRYRSSDETDLLSDYATNTMPDLHSDLHPDLLVDLQDNLQEIYKQICRQYNIGESRQTHKFFIFTNPVPIWSIYSQENAMAHLAGIDKGPVLDWTDDNRLIGMVQKMEEESGNTLPRSSSYHKWCSEM